MKSAQKYVSTPVVARLTQPLAVEMTLPPARVVSSSKAFSNDDSHITGGPDTSRTADDASVNSRILEFNPQLASTRGRDRQRAQSVPRSLSQSRRYSTSDTDLFMSRVEQGELRKSRRLEEVYTFTYDSYTHICMLCR